MNNESKTNLTAAQQEIAPVNDTEDIVENIVESVAKDTSAPRERIDALTIFMLAVVIGFLLGICVGFAANNWLLFAICGILIGSLSGLLLIFLRRK